MDLNRFCSGSILWFCTFYKLDEYSAPNSAFNDNVSRNSTTQNIENV